MKEVKYKINSYNLSKKSNINNIYAINSNK